MITTNSKFFLFFLSILIVCSCGLYLSPVKNFEHKELKLQEQHKIPSSRRQLVIKTTQHDSTNPLITNFPTTPVTNPVTTPVTNPVTTPVTNPVTTPSTATAPPDTSTPAVVTIPSTNPIAGTPTPGSFPITFPPATPTTNPAVPVTNPVTTPSTNFPGAQPVTNPAANFPPSVGSVPVTTPAVAPPVITNAPVVPGQSWCVARSGVPETSIQSALDYACGIGGADCSTIQQGGSCYNPNTLQNHASYAFNSYFQKNPVQTSCDFGGSAAITNVNPSSGSCIFTTLSSGSSPTTTNPATPTPNTASSSGAAPTVSGTPPAIFNPGNLAPGVFNPGNPAPGGIGLPGLGGAGTGFGDISPSGSASSASMPRGLHPFLRCIILITSIVAGRIVLNI